LHRIALQSERVRERERGGGDEGERKRKNNVGSKSGISARADVEAEDEDDDEDEDDVDEIRQGEWADAHRAGKQHRSSSRAFHGRDNSARYSAHAPVIHVFSRLLRPPRSLGALGPRRLARRGRYSPI